MFSKDRSKHSGWREQATLHGVVFDILVGSGHRGGLAAGFPDDDRWNHGALISRPRSMRLCRMCVRAVKDRLPGKRAETSNLLVIGKPAVTNSQARLSAFALARRACRADVHLAAAKLLVPLAGIEPALLAELDFESSASTNSATGAFRGLPLWARREAGGI